MMASEKKPNQDGDENETWEPTSLPAKGRRKISVSWFRQSSFGVSFPKLRLPRQHTIASTEMVDNEEQYESIPENDDPGVSLFKMVLSVSLINFALV